MEYDLLHQPLYLEKRAHKLRRTIPAPNSYYIKVTCKECDYNVVLFSHAQTTNKCLKCTKVMCKPSGGKLKVINNSTFTVIKRDTGKTKKIEKSK